MADNSVNEISVLSVKKAWVAPSIERLGASLAESNTTSGSDSGGLGTDAAS